MSDIDIETLTLNPVEFTPDLTEIDLNELGLSVAAEPGPDYGESSVTVERVRQAISEGITDARWPPVECSIPLIARGADDLVIADPLHRLEGWVADVQRRHVGWIRRDFSDAAGVAGSVGCLVDAAGLTPAQGWSFAHSQFATGITLKLSRYPIWYATVEIEGGEASGSEVRDLQIALAGLLGTAPGLIGIQIKNEGETDWRACAVSVECDDYSAAETAKPVYAAGDLTPRGSSEAFTAEAHKQIRGQALTSGWVTVLSSEIDGVGHMTHVGPRRLRARAKSLHATLWRADWRALGSAEWIPTMEGSTPIIVELPAGEGWRMLDLGECRPERAITGDQRWEFRLRARQEEGPASEPLIRDVYVESAEQRIVVIDTTDTPIAGEPQASPGAVESVAGVGTVAWTNPSYAALRGSKAAMVIFTGAATSKWLKATNFGFAIPSTASILGIMFGAVEAVTSGVGGSVVDAHARVVKGGAIKEAVDRARSTSWPYLGFTEFKYGDMDDLWGQTWTPADINAEGFGFALAVECEGGDQEAGVNGVNAIVAYSEGEEENRICFAGRKLEFTDSGVRRQHVTDEVWGDLMPEGILLRAPVPGQIGNDARALIVPSVGDLAERADSESVSLSAKVTYRPGYLFCREAASE